MFRNKKVKTYLTKRSKMTERKESVPNKFKKKKALHKKKQHKIKIIQRSSYQL